MIGHTFKRLTVVGAAGKDRKRNLLWRCVCSCGGEAVTAGYRLRSGETRSCGCLQREAAANTSRTHGMSGTRLYHIWSSMLARCADERNPDYGGRGITVCAAWREFARFAAWARCSGYADHLTIDRRDNDRGYEPGNCRWATRLEQSRNKRPRKDQKLSDTQVAAIRADPRRARVVAAEYGIHEHYVARLKSGSRRAFPTERDHHESL